MRKRAVALSVAVCLELEEGVVQRRGVTNTAIVTTNSSNDVEMESFMFPEIGEFKNANFELKKEGGKGEGVRGCKGEGEGGGGKEQGSPWVLCVWSARSKPLRVHLQHAPQVGTEDYYLAIR